MSSPCHRRVTCVRKFVPSLVRCSLVLEWVVLCEVCCALGCPCCQRMAVLPPSLLLTHACRAASTAEPPCSTARSRAALWGGNARHQQPTEGCLPLFLAFLHHPHERTARAVASFIFVPKARLEREKCGVPSVLPSFSSPPQACRKLLGLVTHSWRSGLGLGFFFFPFVFRKQFTNCFEHGGAGGV